MATTSPSTVRVSDPGNQPATAPQSPAFTKAEGEAQLLLARTLQALVDSPEYTKATTSWWQRLF